MTVQTPGSGAPQAGGASAPQDGGAGTQQPQDGTVTTGSQPQGGQEPQGGEELTPELRQQLTSWLQANEDTLPGPIRELFRDYRQENRSLRQRLKEGQQGAPQGQPQGDTITREQFQQAEQQWQARLRQEGLKFAVATHAARMGIVDPEAAVRLLDEDDIDYDASGKPTNVDTALKALVRERPWLVQKQGGGSADGGAGGNRPNKVGMNEFLRQATGRGNG